MRTGRFGQREKGKSERSKAAPWIGGREEKNQRGRWEVIAEENAKHKLPLPSDCLTAGCLQKR